MSICKNLINSRGVGADHKTRERKIKRKLKKKEEKKKIGRSSGGMFKTNNQNPKDQNPRYCLRI